jgi:hypothetical protein
MLSIVGPAGSAFADEPAQGCGGTVVAAAQLRTTDGASVGVVQLCRDASAHYRAFLSLSAMSPVSWGNAYLIRYVNGERDALVDCGDDYARPAKPWCVTPSLPGAGAGTTFQATAILCEGVRPACDRVAFGGTQKVRG